ncbi:MAG: type IV secretion system protein [Wolbachia endosymbiont of Menacanthus eurysternus]|nr:MAG: type IV secretion system protein [Wolbachia endosymbiont of Menacanthus eurysternus]
MQLHFYTFWFKLLIFTIYILITSCNKNDMPFPRCISADYFGPEPITISAHFPIGHNAFFPESENKKQINPETNEIDYSFHHDQVVKWKDTEFETNGNDLIVRINGAWTSWNDKKTKSENYSLQSLEQIKYTAKFENKQNNNLPDPHLICNSYKLNNIQKPSNNLNTNCAGYNYSDEGNNIKNTISHRTCWFTNGYGAYFLFKRPGDKNPNESLKSMHNPDSPTIHLDYNTTTENENGLFILRKGDKTKLRDKSCNSLELEKGWKIYVKILDKHYLNNVGGYSFEFLSGVQKPSNFNFFDYIYNYLKCVLLINNKNCKKYFLTNKPAAAQTIFQNIVEKSVSFHNFVLSSLILFIIITSLLYLFGMIQEIKHDILIRMMKITLIIVLISPGSFKFFYNHFLVLFVEGLEYILNLITNFNSNINTDNSLLPNENYEETHIELFNFMNIMFNKFFSYSVWRKFAALLSYQMWTSVLIIPAILGGIILYFLLCVYAYIIFLSGFIGIAFLIAIMPIFLISILFSPLKSLFEGWIKFCISFCLQSIMIFTLLSLLAEMIMDTFYRNLGFTVCYNKWLDIKLCTPEILGGSCFFEKQLFHWTPGQILIPYSIGKSSSLKIDEDFMLKAGTVKFTGGVKYIYIPPNYHNKGFRYVDYPFFNPIPGIKNNPADHYITENDIVVNTNCNENTKNLVRLINSLSHASEKSDILSLIENINNKIDGNDVNHILKLYCQDINICSKHKDIIVSKIKTLIKNKIKRDVDCQLQNFHMLNDKYQENNDYQRVQDIQRGYLINISEVFILFLLSFLMFSLREFVQQMGTNLIDVGYSVYTISSIYEKSNIISLPFKVNGQNINLKDIIYTLKSHWQDTIGNKLESLENWTTRLPNKLTKGTANLFSRIPQVGNILKYTIDVPRKFINTSIETTKFITTTENNVDRLEEKIYKAFGIDKENITHRKISRYINYYKGYMGSHLGYTIEDIMKFTWKHSIDSIRNKYNDNLLYRIKSHRREFLDKLHEYLIGRKKDPEKYENKKDSNQVHIRFKTKNNREY